MTSLCQVILNNQLLLRKTEYCMNHQNVRTFRYFRKISWTSYGVIVIWKLYWHFTFTNCRTFENFVLCLDCQLATILVSDAYHAPDGSATPHFAPEDFFPDSFPQGWASNLWHYNLQTTFRGFKLNRVILFSQASTFRLRCCHQRGHTTCWRVTHLRDFQSILQTCWWNTLKHVKMWQSKMNLGSSSPK